MKVDGGGMIGLLFVSISFEGGRRVRGETYNGILAALEAT